MSKWIRTLILIRTPNLSTLNQERSEICRTSEWDVKNLLIIKETWVINPIKARINIDLN